ncbi:hypothetical protein [Flavobacterium sp.]|uniref:hypothetical protein n=1 Tax=Flavobacterium sp. TaxID=239 RepID=UPI002B4AB007|nr:hypothetical protein [Flavobacterium sp.]HLF51554.1 hypothetical protein [Flavobacterium sp.]
MNVGQVNIKQDDGSIKQITVEEFNAMLGSMKLRLFLDLRLEFFDKQGNPMLSSLALRQIRENK